MQQEMADFAEMDKAPPPPPERSRGEKGRFKAQEKPVEKPVEKPAEEQAKTSTEETSTKTEEAAPTTKSPMRALGERYEGLKKQVESEFKPTIQRLQSEIEKLSKQAADPALNEKLKAAEARAEAAERKLEAEAFVQSPGFDRDFNQPYIKAYNQALSQIQQLVVRYQDGKNEMDEPIIKTRPAEEKDLLELANMPLGEMDDRLQKMFGASAHRVGQQIERLKELATAKAEAAADGAEKAQQFRRHQQEAAEARAKAMAQHWKDVNQSLEEKFPKAFKPEEGDTEDSTAHTRGFALADLLFIGERGLRPEQVDALPPGFKDAVKTGKPLTDEQKIQLTALARLKMANHDRQIARVKKLQARVAELEKEVAEYEKSEPAGKVGSRDEQGGASRDWLETAEDELRALDK